MCLRRRRAVGAGFMADGLMPVRRAKARVSDTVTGPGLMQAVMTPMGQACKRVSVPGGVCVPSCLERNGGSKGQLHQMKEASARAQENVCGLPKPGG